jgi:hypothetical protein
MGGPGCVYLKEENTLILKSLEQGETEISLPGKTLKVALRRTEEGFNLRLSTLRGVLKIKKLVIENTGPGLLGLTEGLPERIESFRLSRDGRSLKVIGLKLTEMPIELNFMLVPLDLDGF